jgi:hypothetical protein
MFAFLQRYTTSLKNLALISGIGVVLAVQLGLTTYVSTADISEKSFSIVNRADESIAPINSGRGIENAKLYPEDLVEDEVIPVSSVERRKNIANASLRKDSPRGKVVRRLPEKIRAIEIETVAASKAHKVTKERANDLRSFESSDLSDSDMIADLKGNSSKRSFVSVIKKPYSWVKALGSKIF